MNKDELTKILESAGLTGAELNRASDCLIKELDYQNKKDKRLRTLAAIVDKRDDEYNDPKDEFVQYAVMFMIGEIGIETLLEFMCKASGYTIQEVREMLERLDL
jgi:hypothetical protein